MFNYEENERKIKAATLRCIRESFSYNGIDDMDEDPYSWGDEETDTMSGNTKSGSSFKRRYFVPKMIDVTLTITKKSANKKKVICTVKSTSPATGQPFVLKNIVLEKQGTMWNDVSDFDLSTLQKNKAYRDAEINMPQALYSFLSNVVCCVPENAMDDDDYEVSEDDMNRAVLPVITNLVNKALKNDGVATTSLESPYTDEYINSKNR